MENFFLERRLWIVLSFKVAIITLSFLFAFLLRFDFAVPAPYWTLFLKALLPLIVIKLAAFWKMGLGRGWWRYVSLADVFDVLKANLLGSTGVVVFIALTLNMAGFPRSVLILDGVFCFLGICGIRFATRAFRENYFPIAPLNDVHKKAQVLIVGAGDAGQTIAREIRQNPTLGKTVVGFIDDDPKKLRARFQGVPVLGDRETLGRVCLKYNIEEVIIAIPSAPGSKLRPIVERCEGIGVKFKTLPGVGELIDGKVTVQEIRDVDVEDLLRRKPVQLDIARIKDFLKDRRVLVTGAGGSIGSEICRQVARFAPSKLILFDNAETSLFYIEQELCSRFPEVPISPIVGDIRYRSRLEAIFDEFMPEVVFHAAAYKHVPMMEHNPAEAVNNNIRGTKILADAAISFGVQRFVLISTDKAVNPTNVMGASKRAAELYVQSLSRKSKTAFVTVRFGNVLGSNGSVIPTFKEQIRKGGPVTVTHPEVTRFFMTIPEASQLVLQAGSMGRGGEIFLLDMGEPVKITDLAEELIKLSGLVPYEDIPIEFTGLRPGEKLYEELLLASEGTLQTDHDKICIARAGEVDAPALHRQLEKLFQSARAMDLEAVLARLHKIVPEYRGQQVAPQAKVIPHPSLGKRESTSSGGI